FCKDLNKNPKTPVPTTGLGLSPPNPIRLARRLDTFFGSSSSKSSVCDCKCGSTPDKSCCCLACPGNCLKSCDAKCGSKCSHGSPSDCPRKTFCQNINSIKVTAQSGLMRCCERGQKCHCQVDKICSPSTPGQKCCETGKKSIKCLIRRLVSYFKSLGPNPSNPDFSKKCCDLLCVAKTCEFLWSSLKNTKTGPGQKFYHELSKLQYSSPCGHDLWRTLKDFLYYCVHMVGAYVQSINTTLSAKGNSCPQCKSLKPSDQHPSPCSCNGSDCKPCDVLLKDSHLMAILTRKFSSSYDSSKASWSLLCPSSPCCGSSPCNSCRSSPCPDNGCCEKCPKRLCAKIFLGILPCMYWGLKIVYDRSKYNSGFAGWHDISVSNGKPESALAKFFHAWGFNVSPLRVRKGSEFFVILKDLFGSDSDSHSGPITKLYLSVKLYIQPVPSSNSKPKTVREILLWLYGLRFQKHFSEFVENCKSLCSPFGNSFHPDAFCYYLHLSCFLLPVSVISFIETSESAQKVFSSSSEFSKFLYPSDPSKLFEAFCEYVRKIFVALKFLCIQCERNAGHAGWQYCYFGKECAEKFKGNSLSSPPSTSPSTSSSDCSCPNSGAYLCTASGSNKDVHDHCKDGQTCLGFASTSCDPSSAHPKSQGKTCTPCPHPLMRFLIDDSSDSQSSDSKSLFKLPSGSSVPPMGFSKENLPSPGRNGHVLHGVLKVFCDSGYYPLTRLAEFSVCVSRHPPETLGEFFGFFRRFRFSDVFTSMFADYVSGEPGFYSGSDLKTALENLFKHTSGSSHSADLQSLYYCDGPKGSSGTPPTCGGYLYPLIADAYNNNIFIDDFLDTYLSWICYSAEDFKKKLKEFQGEFLDCCSSCQNIVDCPCILPKFYKYGFAFASPISLNCPRHDSGGHSSKPQNCTRKTCKDFISQLKLVVDGDLVKKLLEEIPKFIWSIRLPFFFGFLYVWFFVLSYFFYVILIKLDTVHTGSHLHLPRSFKILPSTLFSDASSKLKDLSYFTL
ncbi:variant erythrocyte surface antigen-1 family protein, partial [Babesia divergens]